MDVLSWGSVVGGVSHCGEGVVGGVSCHGGWGVGELFCWRRVVGGVSCWRGGESGWSQTSWWSSVNCCNLSLDVKSWLNPDCYEVWGYRYKESCKPSKAMSPQNLRKSYIVLPLYPTGADSVASQALWIVPHFQTSVQRFSIYWPLKISAAF